MFGISIYENSNSELIPKFSSHQLANFDYIELTLGDNSFDTTAALEEPFILNKRVRVVHLPELNFSNLNKHKLAIKKLSEAGIGIFNIHLFSSKSKISLEKRIECIRDFENLASTGLTITVENTAEGTEDFERLFSKAGRLRFCLDVGHANLGGDPGRSGEFIDKFSDRLSLIHIHDNLGGLNEKCDLHLPLGKGTIDFSQIFSRLRQAKYKGPVTLELYKASYSEWMRSLIYAKKLNENL